MLKKVGNYFEMKRIFVFFLCAVILLMTACTPAPTEPSDEDTRAASIVRMCEQAGLSVGQAKELLDVLKTLGYTGEVLFAYPAIDEDDAEYLHVWIGERTVDVYYAADGHIRLIKQSGILLYGDEQVPSDESGKAPTKPNEREPDEPVPSEQPTEPSEPTEPEQPPAETTLTLDDMSAQVMAGGEAHVRVYGRAGEQYRITVYLKSGASTAKGLEDKTPDAEGLITWEWNVSSRTTPGDYRIVIERISDERDALELPFTISSKVE